MSKQSWLIATAFFVGALTSLALIGCGGAQPTASQSAENQDALSKEVEPLKKVKLRAPDNSWTAVIEAAETPGFNVADDAVTIEAPIGAEVPPIVCILYTGTVEPGGTITKTFGPTAPKKYTEINIKEISALKDGAIFLMEGYHEIRDATGGVETKLTKMAVFDHPYKSAVCLHEEMGYRETFARISKGFFESIDKQSPDKIKPKFTEIWVRYIEEEPSAVGRTEYYDLEDGTKKIVERETSLDKYKPGAIYGDDVSRTTMTDANNFIISDHFTMKRGGYDLIKFTLDPTEDGEKYKYYIKAEGAPSPMTGTFPRDPDNGMYPGAPNNVVARKKIQELVKNKVEENFTMNEFHASGDPRKSTKVTYWVEAEEAPAKLTVVIGEMKIHITADAQGIPDTMEMSVPTDPMNPNIIKKVTAKRVYMEGAL